VERSAETPFKGGFKMPKTVCSCGETLEFKDEDKSVECPKCKKKYSIFKIGKGVYILR